MTARSLAILATGLSATLLALSRAAATATTAVFLCKLLQAHGAAHLLEKRVTRIRSDIVHVLSILGAVRGGRG